MSDEPRARRRSLIDAPTPTEVREVARDLDTAENLIFRPTDAQNRAKSRLLVRLDENPVASLDSLTCAEASKLSSYGWKNYWGQPGFRDWLLSKTEFRERVEYLVHKSLDRAEDILDLDDPKLASSQVALLKQLAELASKFPKNSSAAMLDKVVADMNQLELDQFIKENTAKLPSAEFEDIDGEVDESK